jgi:SAM-dependent methyltransferase
MVRRAPTSLVRGYRRISGSQYTPRVGAVRFGDLRRVTPISSQWGFSRGGAVDRYYIEQFLDRHATDVSGRVLEIGSNSYTVRLGGHRVTCSDVLNIVPREGATFVGDLAAGEFLPSNTFDCIVLTQTLQMIFDFPSALRTIARILSPGGVLLLTVPGITMVDPGEWGSTWHYSFSHHAVQRMCDEFFSGWDADVAPYGNALAAIAFLHGLGSPELTRAELDHCASEFAVVTTARVVKPV